MTADLAYEFASRRRAVADGLPLFAPVAPAPTRAVARRSDPETSHQAAASVGDADTITEKQRSVLRLMPVGRGVTDEQIAEAYAVARRVARSSTPEQSASGLRSRRAELADAEKLLYPMVECTGKVRGSTGRQFRVWRLTAAGLRARGEG